MINYLGGRKFVLSILLLILNFFLLFTGKIDNETWKWLVTAIFGVYVAGNVVSKLEK